MHDSPNALSNYANLRAMMPWVVRQSSLDLQRARGAYRNPHARDRARVLHSRSFRRLQGKLCWGGLDSGEVMRSRMIQTLETGQLSRGLLRALQGLHSADEPWMPLLPDPNLIEAIAFARHLGTAPFGSRGEATLQDLMRHHGGFASGAQALRLLARREPYEEGFGLDLSRRALLGTMQSLTDVYPEDGDVVRWVLMPLDSADTAKVLTPPGSSTVQPHGGRTGAGSLDGSIVSIAASIAAACHEFEDGITLGVIRHAEWQALTPESGWAAAVDLEQFAQLGHQLFHGSMATRKRAMGTLINAFVVSVEVECREGVQEPLMRWQAQLMPQAHDLIEQLQRVVRARAHDNLRVQAHEQQGATLMGELFSACANDPHTLLPPELREAHQAASSDIARLRLIADHVAGLSDAQVSMMHERLHRL